MKIPPKNPRIPLPLCIVKELNPRIAYLIGILRDGSFRKPTRNIYRVSIYQKNYEFIKNTLLPIFRKEFDRELKVYRGKNSFECVITEKQFYKEFREVCEFPENRHQQYWDVPQIIKHSPREIKKWFVTGFFDAEGTVYPKKAEKTQKPKIVFYSSWYERDKCPPLEFIRNFLNEIGIKTGNVNGPYKITQVYSYELAIKSKREILKFCKLLKSLHPEKSKHLNFLSSFCRKPGSYGKADRLPLCGGETAVRFEKIPHVRI